SGTEPRPYRDVFALLNHEYLAPHDWRPGVRRGEIHDFRTVTPTNSDRRHALAAMPSLLRSYLTMGGRVSDHAVIDRVLNTLHIFIGLEISHIPESRKRLLRLIAAESGSDESA